VADTYSYSRAHRAFEIASITLFFALLGHLGWRLWTATSTAGGFAALGLAALLGYLAADFVSGVVHWAGDTVGDQSTPIFGKNFITHFRNHHTDPKGITWHDFVETNGNNCIVTLPVLAIADYATPSGEGIGLFFCAFAAFLGLFVFGTNQFHKWAHADRPPAAARWLQRWGLILSPRHHQIHHDAPHDKYYCITVGWMNPVLHKLRFFRALERIIAVFRPELLYLDERKAFAAAGERPRRAG